MTLHTTFLGGGFGRRANPATDFVAEAVHVAKAAGSAGEDRVDARERHAGRATTVRPSSIGPASVSGEDGHIAAWDHVAVGQSIMAGTFFEPMMAETGIDPSSVEGLTDSPYVVEVPNRRVGLHTPALGVPVLWWRSVGHTHTAFAVESLVDEAAHAAGRDPVEYRRELLKNHKRHLGVLNLAAEKAGWGSALPAGRARGVAVHESFGSFVAEVAEVSVEDGKIRVHRVVAAIDCGIAVNPATISAQLKGAIAFGLSATLHSAITMKDGRVQESNFHDYKVLRLSEMPAVETYIVPSTDPPGGVGEPGTPPIAPAVANAVFALTGTQADGPAAQAVDREVAGRNESGGAGSGPARLRPQGTGRSLHCSLPVPSRVPNTKPATAPVRPRPTVAAAYSPIEQPEAESSSEHPTPAASRPRSIPVPPPIAAPEHSAPDLRLRVAGPPRSAGRPAPRRWTRHRWPGAGAHLRVDTSLPSTWWPLRVHART